MLSEASREAVSSGSPRPATEPLPLLPPKVWPIDPEEAIPRGTLAAAFVAGIVGAITLRISVVSVGLFATGIAIFAVAFSCRHQRPSGWQAGAAFESCALLAVGAIRSAPWLMWLCGSSAWALGSLALVEGSTWSGLTLGSLAAWFAPIRASKWAVRGAARLRVRGVPTGRAVAVATATMMLVTLFGALFASADAAYAHVLSDVFPATSVADVARRAFVFCCVAAGALVAAYLAHRPPRFDELAPRPSRSLATWEWAVPLGALDLLFASFVTIEVAVLFGGREHVLATRGLTYAEYARQGFWQLTAVTIMTLLIVALAVRKAARSTAKDRMLVRLLLGALCVLSLVIVASAVHRMSVYERQYGFTTLRLLVETTELWLGAVFVLILVAGIRLNGRWLPRAVICSAAIAILVLAWMNPDAYIARQNVARYDTTGRVDVQYLASLSSDAVPALQELPEPFRSCVLLQSQRQLEPQPWYEFNLGRLRAERSLRANPVAACRP